MKQTILSILLNTKSSNHVFFQLNHQCYMSFYNLYEAYISYLRTRVLEKNFTQQLELHHVKPLHSTKIKRGSLEDKNEEKLTVTYKEHFLCHYYRYLALREKGDLMFLQLRASVDVDKAALCRQLGGSTAGKLNTPAQQNQRKKHLKSYNPSKGASSLQRLHSQYLGKTYGKKAGMSRQDPVTRNRIQEPMHWVHTNGTKVFIPKAETLQEIMEILNQNIPNSVKFTSGLSNIIRGVEKRRYGWTLS